MRIATYCFATLVVSALAGCMTNGRVAPSGPGTRINCPGNMCEAIVVKVEESGTPANPKCKVVSVSIRDASVTGQAAGPKTMLWTLPQDVPYEFSRTDYKFGIFIKDDPAGKFRNATSTGKTLRITFNHDSVGEANWYAYAITVVRSGSHENPKFCETLDPWLVG